MGHTVVQKSMKMMNVYSGVEFTTERKRIRRLAGATGVARRVLQQRLQEVIASSEIHEFSAHARDTSSIL